MLNFITDTENDTVSVVVDGKVIIKDLGMSGSDTERGALVRLIVEAIDGCLYDADKEIRSMLDNPDYYDNYFCDTDTDEVRKNLADLLGVLPSEITDKFVNLALVTAKVELSNGYHSAENTIELVSLYGSEYIYEVDFTDIDGFAALKYLTEEELADIMYSSSLNKGDNLLGGLVEVYTQHSCTPCLVVSDEFLESFDPREPLGPTKLSPKELRSTFKAVDGGVKVDTVDAIKTRMRVNARNADRVKSERRQGNKDLTRRL